MPEIISTPNALVQTTNGKRFYLNSGLISADNTETTIIDITNIGERDIRLNLNPIFQIGGNGDKMTMKVKNNGSIIYQSQFLDNDANLLTAHTSPIPFIIPANTSLIITFTNSDATTHDVGVSCYGKYLSM